MHFFTGKFIGVTLLNVIALAVVAFIPNRNPAWNGLLVAALMAPTYFVIDSLKKAMPRANQPPDDGMYSIAGAGLQAIEKANAERTDWVAVAFYTAYECFILGLWFIAYHFSEAKVATA
ncbi:MAG TPA: hypothetical protein VIM67_11675 [Terriglobus sp.]